METTGDARFKVIADAAAVGIFVRGAERFEYVNPTLAVLLGYSVEELLGMDPLALVAPADRARVGERLKQQLAGDGQPLRVEMRVLRKDGAPIDVELHSTRVTLAGRPVVVGSVLDVRWRRGQEAELLRLNRRLTMLLQCSHALIHAVDERGLLQRLCELVVDRGGYVLAWVSVLEGERLIAVARAGAHQDFVDALGTATTGAQSTPRPSLVAVQSERPFVVRDIATDAAVQPWRALALARGFRATIALPLRGADGRPFGSLAMCSGQAGDFDDTEVELLGRLAEDVGYGIAALRIAAEHRVIFENNMMGIAFLKDRRVVRCNRALAELIGWSPELLVGQSTRVFHVSDEAWREIESESAEIGRRGFVSDERELRRRDGSRVWTNNTLTAVDPRDLSRGIVWVAQDVTARRNAALALERELRLNRLVSALATTANEAVKAPRALEACLEHLRAYLAWPLGHLVVRAGALGGDAAPFGLWTADDQERYRAFIAARDGSAAAVAAGAPDPMALAGTTPVWLADLGQDGPAALRALARTAGLRAAFAFPVPVEDQAMVWFEFFSGAAQTADHTLLARLGVAVQQIARIVERARVWQALQAQATRDPLTGLANRTLLADRLEQALVHAQRTSRQVTLLVLDLDRFKIVNDTLGHRAGDELLRMVANRLAAAVRPGDTVARLGGDEFVVVLSDVARAEDVAELAQKILDAVSGAVALEGEEVCPGVSIGVAVFPGDATDGESLLARADAAMYHAKGDGGGTVRFFAIERNR